MNDYYQTLGVDRNASPKEIARAYRRLAAHLHPDSNPDADGEAFKQVSEAYEVLSHTDQRSFYDQHGRARPPGITHENDSHADMVSLVCQTIEEVIEKNPHGDLFHYVGLKLKAMLQEGQTALRNEQRRVDSYTQRLSRLTGGTDANRDLILTVMEKRKDQFREQIEEIENDLKIVHSAIEFIDGMNCGDAWGGAAMAKSPFWASPSREPVQWHAKFFSGVDGYFDSPGDSGYD